ncbi:MAG TPA: hypothetical protein VIA06_12450 [Candidatus Dormibacteraeota bacterium]|jgi:hypothetical protein|nr:hypothetical protein [Candidatus Dormibacteraeota bacterium]
MNAQQRREIDKAGYLPRGISLASAGAGFATLMVGIVGDVFNVIQSWPLWDTLGAALAGTAVTAWKWGQARRGNVELQFELKGMAGIADATRRQLDEARHGREVQRQRTRGDALETLLDAGYDVSLKRTDERGHDL